MTALKRWRNKKKYQMKLNLLAKIRRELAPVLAAKQKAEEW